MSRTDYIESQQSVITKQIPKIQSIDFSAPVDVASVDETCYDVGLFAISHLERGNFILFKYC